MSSDETRESLPVAAPKAREAVFDVAKGIGILLVVFHHSFNNSSRLYTDPRSWGWWGLTLGNRVLSFSVPVFLLISAVLSARSLVKKPEIVPFYKRRLPAILWPYVVWTIVYWVLRATSEKGALATVNGRILGFPITGPAFLVHLKLRWLDLVWGKAFFHLYFLVVLFELIILLPLAVTYVQRRKPGFYEVLATAFLLQGVILIGQHLTALLPYPASNALWYIGSLLPGAWIGVHWDTFVAQSKRFIWPLVGLSLISGFLFLRQEIGLIHHIPADNYISNGSLAVYSSCMSVLVLLGAQAVSDLLMWRSVLEPLGRHSLQIYLIHPAVMQLLQRQRIVGVLNMTYLGVMLSMGLLLGTTFGVIWLMRVCRMEKLMFGRT